MQRRISLSLLSVFACLLLASQTVHATTPPQPDPASTSTSEADAAAAAAARAAASQHQRAEGGEATVYGDTSSYSSRALALGLGSMAAAPAVAGECLIHTRGVGVFGIGVTGGTRFDEPCMEDVRRDRFTASCLQIADRYAAANLVEAFVRQLEKCGGVHLDALPAPAAASNPPVGATTAPPGATSAPPAAYIPPASASKEELAALEERVNDRMNRIFRQGIGK